MIKNLRTVSNQVMIRILLVLIIISFIFTGIGSYFIRYSKEYVAIINGQEISPIQLEQAVKNVSDNLKKQLGDKFVMLVRDEDYIKNLRNQILNQLIDNVLLDQYAKKIGFIINDKQVQKFIWAIPMFQKNNNFNNTKYLRIIDSMGLTPDKYAHLIRQQLVRQTLIKSYTDTDFTLPTEIKDIAAIIMQKRDIHVAKINSNLFEKEQKVTNEDVQNYYEQNKYNFITPEAVKVSYIKIDITMVQDKVTVSDDEIKSYYRHHQSNYIQPERKKYSLIEVKTVEDARNIINELNNGANFAKIAAEKSIEIISRKNNGNLGWLEISETPDEIITAKLMKKGQISKIIKSKNHYFIFLLNNIKPAQTKPLTKVYTEIKIKIKKQKIRDAFSALQQKVQESARMHGNSLAVAASSIGVKAVETNWFIHNHIPDALNFTPVKKAIFKDTILFKNNSHISNFDIINVEDDRAFIICISGYKPKTIKEITKVKDQIIKIIKHQKAIQKAYNEGNKILTILQTGKDYKVIEKEKGIKFSEMQTVTRNSKDHQLTDAIFSLPHPQKNKPVYGLMKDIKDNIVLMQLDKVQDQHLVDKQIKDLSYQILKNKSSIIFDSLINNLRANAVIKLNPAIC
ncbi:peptidylprolyl isomerase [Candidatus Profftia sp. (ex Adelges kitamiensis)]|uniref:peptidylprolyl isomerase n=1 Tax=Candidatus Profftia sp. (ex Adelges kitamiensis) TaxID=2864218 RepID=UPI001CE3126E|nr:peptidylprolyl isomerase [Candidatus Profftia sp. (ex Adelges kitamiensis)]